MRKLRRHIPSGNLLYVFDAAARLESFTRAADELNVTPAAVSHAIRQLEQCIGLPLFHRRHRGEG
jgi:LysR family glycine cleavage system transcriptional activator